MSVMNSILRLEFFFIFLSPKLLFADLFSAVTHMGLSVYSVSYHFSFHFANGFESAFESETEQRRYSHIRTREKLQRT